MRGEVFAEFAARPADEQPWEELLVRFELAPRALRHTVEDAAADELQHVGGDGRSALDHLRHLAERETRAGEWLRALRERGTIALDRFAALPAAPADPVAAARQYLHDFTAQRGRNFAWVQRRGLEVWDWRSDLAGGGSVTAHQLISYLVRHDGLHLAAVRAALRESA